MAQRMGTDIPRELRHELVWQKATRMVPDFVGFRCDSHGDFFMAVSTPTGASRVVLAMDGDVDAVVHFVRPYDPRYRDAPFLIYGV
jgi:hypothetical protein